VDDADRFRLLRTYRTPRFRIGGKILCEVRGEVTICGLSDAPISWRIGKRRQAQAGWLKGATFPLVLGWDGDLTVS
jgi:hypothetical protein